MLHFCEPPSADPHARWCGGWGLNTPGYPIGLRRGLPDVASRLCLPMALKQAPTPLRRARKLWRPPLAQQRRVCSVHSALVCEIFHISSVTYSHPGVVYCPSSLRQVNIIVKSLKAQHEMGGRSVVLQDLAVQGKVTASTQNQALNAIVFLYRQVLKKDFGWVEGVVRAKKPARLPVVFTRQEARAVLARLDGIRWVMASLLYGFGLRLMECTRLRVKDVDLRPTPAHRPGRKGRQGPYHHAPGWLVEPLKTHLEKVAVLHKKDLSEGFGAVYLPFPLEKKYPNANREWRYSPPHIAPSIHALRDRPAPSHRPHGLAARGQ